MKSLPTELIYVLVFAAIVLFQYMMRRFGPQQQPQSPQDEPAPEFPGQGQATPVISPVSVLSDIRFGLSEAPSALAALPKRRFSRRSLMGTRRDVQNAIVIATILGPCRADEPHDIR